MGSWISLPASGLDTCDTQVINCELFVFFALPAWLLYDTFIFLVSSGCLYSFHPMGALSLVIGEF